MLWCWYGFSKPYAYITLYTLYFPFHVHEVVYESVAIQGTVSFRRRPRGTAPRLASSLLHDGQRQRGELGCFELTKPPNVAGGGPAEFRPSPPQDEVLVHLNRLLVKKAVGQSCSGGT
jgi:hypothetical protein